MAKDTDRRPTASQLFDTCRSHIDSHRPSRSGEVSVIAPRGRQVRERRRLGPRIELQRRRVLLEGPQRPWDEGFTTGSILRKELYLWNQVPAEQGGSPRNVFLPRHPTSIGPHRTILHSVAEALHSLHFKREKVTGSGTDPTFHLPKFNPPGVDPPSVGIPGAGVRSMRQACRSALFRERPLRPS